MAKLKENFPKSLPEYLKLVENLQRKARIAERQQKAQQSLWFRGVGRVKYQLIPSLYRHPTMREKSQLNNLERELMMRFRQRSVPYLSKDLSDHLDALFFIQHYGVPTRLLDWTENSLVGLHFALMSAASRVTRRRRVTYAGPAVVWVLDPMAWNRTALKHVSYKGGPLTPGDEDLKGYSPSSSATTMAKYPVALHGPHNSPRIVAQRGVFTIFGANRTPMEALVRKGIFPSQSLSRIIIQPAHIPKMRDSLLTQGITESMVFPDLEGLARETKRHFGFET